MLASVFTKTVRDRWKAMAIGVVTLALLFLMGMSTYRTIDLSVYTDLPEVFRALVNIPADADVASLAYGAVFTSYGAMTLSAIVLVMGAGSIAGEERNGTLGLLLGNPKSRTSVLLSKAAAITLLAALGTLVLWGAGRLTPVILGVDVSGITVEALMVHMFVSALLYGFLAMAIGAWTGNQGLASGATAGIMVVSFVAVGLLPLIEGLENAAKAFPWYYFSGSNPHLNGISWGHLAVLLAAIAVSAVIAVIGVDRRDLRGQTTGVSMIDRLRANPMTQQVADRLAGSARVSRIWIKTASEYQGLLFVTAALMFLFMGVMIGPMYNFIEDSLQGFSDTFPEALLALVGGGDVSTPEGWYQVETFGLMAPIAVMIVTVIMGGRALAGEEANRTMGLLLANPISRSAVLLQKTLAMVLYGLAVGFATFAGVAVGSLVGGLGMDMGNIAATSLLVTLLGLVFGALALALSAGTGRVPVATYGAVGVALVLFLLNAFLPLNNRLAGYAKWSPFYYYLSSDPLNNGMHWGHGALLAGLTAALIGVSILVFRRRDLREGN